VVKYLVEQGANIHSDGDYAARKSAVNGHLKVFKYLVGQGANIHLWKRIRMYTLTKQI
jgi:hypothetical protein